MCKTLEALGDAEPKEGPEKKNTTEPNRTTNQRTDNGFNKGALIGASEKVCQAADATNFYLQKCECRFDGLAARILGEKRAHVRHSVADFVSRGSVVRASSFLSRLQQVLNLFSYFLRFSDRID